MRKFEYKQLIESEIHIMYVEKYKGNDGKIFMNHKKPMIIILNDYGAMGWELVSIIKNLKGDTTYTLKRGYEG